MELRTSIYVIATVFILYAGLMLVIGGITYRKTAGISDFFLGGRNLNPWVGALSAQASDMSGWLLMGLPGLAYVSTGGMAEAFWTALGLLIGTLLNWIIIARRFRRYTEIAGDSITLPDYFANRFHSNKSTLRMIAALFILIFFILYTAAQFNAGAKLFTVVFPGLSYQGALIIGSIIIIGYTFLGGFLAVCWTDFIQGILMFVALILVPVFAFRSMDTAQLGSFVNEFSALIPGKGSDSVGVLAVVSAIAWGLGYFGMPHILTRFMGMKSSKEIKPATVIAMIWVTFSLAAGVLVGWIGRYVMPGINAVDSEKIFMGMSDRFFPPIIVGILLTAILAAIMSSADSMLLVASSAFSKDLYKNNIRKAAGEKELMWASRITVLAVALIAIVLASDEESTVFSLVSYAWAGFGSAFGPAILLSLYWKRMTGKGALAGVVSGGLVSLFWTYKATGLFGIPWLLKFEFMQGGLYDIYALVPGFAISLICIIVFSLLDKKPSAEIEKEFDLAASRELLSSERG